MKRFLLGVAGVAVAFTALMGYAHTPGGRPLLAAMGRVLGRAQYCPLGYDKTQTVAERGQLRSGLARDRRALPLGPAPDLDGLVLGVTPQADVLAWFSRRGGRCEALPNRYNYECEGRIAGDRTGTFWLEFGASAHLVGFRAIENFTREGRAAERFANAAKAMAAARNGRMGKGLLAQVSSEARYRNFEGRLRLTNMGNHFALTENFLSY